MLSLLKWHLEKSESLTVINTSWRVCCHQSLLVGSVIIIMTCHSSFDNWLLMICVHIIIALSLSRFETCESGRGLFLNEQQNSFSSNLPRRPSPSNLIIAGKTSNSLHTYMQLENKDFFTPEIRT